jgi:hypothetical protein
LLNKATSCQVADEEGPYQPRIGQNLTQQMNERILLKLLTREYGN